MNCLPIDDGGHCPATLIRNKRERPLPQKPARVLPWLGRPGFFIDFQVMGPKLTRSMERRGNTDSDLLHTEKILADRKTFFLDLKENSRGRVVKITEDVGGNRDTIMVPAEILGDFIAALTDIKATADSRD